MILYGFQEPLDFFFAEVAPGAFGQIPEIDVGDPDAFQSGNTIACFPDHAADLSVAAFFELDKKPLGGTPPDNGGSGFTSQDGDTRFEFFQGSVGYGGRHGHHVLLFVVKGRVQQMVVEISIIGHE